MASDILIVDDEEDIRTLIGGILEDEGYDTRIAANSDEAFKAISTRQPSLIILDVWLQNSAYDGLQMLDRIKREHPEQQVVMISGHATFDMAVSATKIGAYDFLTKPIKIDVLLHTVNRAVDDARLRRENRELQETAGDPVEELAGVSAATGHLRQTIARVAPTESRVLITGPTGAGKSVIARLIHNHSARRNGPFVVLGCAGISSGHIEASLFGLEANGDRPRSIGAFERAHRGTLLLDEVSSLSPEVQGTLVKVLHKPHFRRVGSDSEVEVDVRVIASTNRELKAEMEAGTFRSDLFHRLNVVSIEIPALKDRREDIPMLAEQIMRRSAASKKRPPRPFMPDALAALQAHDWPGNAWELVNVVERLLLFGASDDPLDPVRGEQVIDVIGQESAEVARWDQLIHVMNLPLRDARGAFETEYLRFHLLRFGGNISRTAEFVGMDRAALHRKLKGLGLAGTARLDRHG